MARISFPLRIDNQTGGLAISTGGQAVQEQILEILTTPLLSRVLRPEFGSDNYLFDALTDANLIASRLRLILKNNLSANIVTEVKVTADENGKLDIDIKWTDTSTQQFGNVTTQLDF